MGFLAAKCPVCGADIQVDGDMSKCFCMYCGSQIQVQNAINSISVDGVCICKCDIDTRQSILANI